MPMNVDWSWNVGEDYGLMAPLSVMLLHRGQRVEIGDWLEQALTGGSGGASAFGAGLQPAPTLAV